MSSEHGRRLSHFVRPLSDEVIDELMIQALASFPKGTPAKDVIRELVRLIEAEINGKLLERESERARRAAKRKEQDVTRPLVDPGKHPRLFRRNLVARKDDVEQGLQRRDSAEPETHE